VNGKHAGPKYSFAHLISIAGGVPPAQAPPFCVVLDLYDMEDRTPSVAVPQDHYSTWKLVFQCNSLFPDSHSQSYARNSIARPAFLLDESEGAYLPVLLARTRTLDARSSGSLCLRNHNCSSTFRGQAMPLWHEAKALRHILSL
jgi:hypothetical protein